MWAGPPGCHTMWERQAGLALVSGVRGRMSSIRVPGFLPLYQYRSIMFPGVRVGHVLWTRNLTAAAQRHGFQAPAIDTAFTPELTCKDDLGGYDVYNCKYSVSRKLDGGCPSTGVNRGCVRFTACLAYRVYDAGGLPRRDPQEHSPCAGSWSSTRMELCGRTPRPCVEMEASVCATSDSLAESSGQP